MIFWRPLRRQSDPQFFQEQPQLRLQLGIGLDAPTMERREPRADKVGTAARLLRSHWVFVLDISGGGGRHHLEQIVHSQRSQDSPDPDYRGRRSSRDWARP